MCHKWNCHDHVRVRQTIYCFSICYKIDDPKTEPASLFRQQPPGCVDLQPAMAQLITAHDRGG